MLGREDMKKEAMPFSNKEENMGEIPVVRHEAPANGIDYITLMFECNDIAEEEVPYLGLLRAVLGYVNTDPIVMPILQMPSIFIPAELPVGLVCIRI